MLLELSQSAEEDKTSSQAVFSFVQDVANVVVNGKIRVVECETMSSNALSDGDPWVLESDVEGWRRKRR
jgi:hypothetical protein